MNLTLDLEGKTNRILREFMQGFSSDAISSSSSQSGFNLLGIESLLAKRKEKAQIKRFQDSLDEFTLVLEGFHGHISKLSLTDAQNLLVVVQDTITKFDSFDEKIAESSYLCNSEFRKHVKYALKTLYKTEALLDLVIYKGADRIKTPDYIKEGLAKMSQEALLKSLK